MLKNKRNAKKQQMLKTLEKHYSDTKTIMSTKDRWKIWEIFIRSKNGLSHKHVGSLHAPDAEMALKNARDVYTRRNEGISIWVVPSDAIVASSPDEKEPLFTPADDKVYRHPTFYDIPDEIGHM